MKIISYNIRGLGGRVKRRKIKELVRAEKIDFICVQETRKEAVDIKLVESLWGDGERRLGILGGKRDVRWIVVCVE